MEGVGHARPGKARTKAQKQGVQMSNPGRCLSVTKTASWDVAGDAAGKLGQSQAIKDQRCDSVVECMSHMCEAMGLILAPQNNNNNGGDNDNNEGSEIPQELRQLASN